MKSPFPGMDPYIEELGLFEDFHGKIISEIERYLSETVPERYIVRTAERPYVVIAEPNGKEEHVFNLDDGITAERTSQPDEKAGVGTAVAEPATEQDVESISMRAFIATDYRENFIEIYLTDPERLLVTCIEVLSLSNKRPGTDGWDIYLRKRQGLLLGGANLVEIDLLRSGTKFPMMDAWPASPYSLLVSRRGKPGSCRVWPAHFRRPLPTIPVPLVAPDADVELNLQPMIDAVFARSRYYRDIDYSRELTKRLAAEEAEWLSQRLKAMATR